MKHNNPAVDHSAISRAHEMSEPTASEEPAGYERGMRMLPVAAILLPLMAYMNLWITNLVPGYGWFEQTLPRVLLTLLTIGYLMIIWITGPTPRAATLQRARLWRGFAEAGAVERTLTEHRAIATAIVNHEPELARAAAVTHVIGLEMFLRRKPAA